jgi:hypothetical protein
MNTQRYQFVKRLVFTLCIIISVAGIGVPVYAASGGNNSVATPTVQENLTAEALTITPLNETTVSTTSETITATPTSSPTAGKTTSPTITPTATTIELPIKETTTVRTDNTSTTPAITSSGVNASGLATPSADFFIQGNYEADSVADSISSGAQPMRYWGDIKISNLNDDSNTVLGNITIDVAADGITGVEYSDDQEYSVTWNRTHAKWKFPSDLYIGEGKAVSTTWDTDYSSSQYIPMSMKRSINKTIFTSDGYQLVTFNVTFENSTYTTIWGVISAEQNPLEYVDATLLNETFTTDAPIKSFDTAGSTNNYFAFWLDPNRVELGKPYQFSMVIRVNVTTTDGSAVKYTPRCAIGLSTHTSSGTIGNGYTVSMPSGALPSHTNSASVSTNVSNAWTYSSGFIQKMAFAEVCQKLSASEIGVFRPSAGNWYLDTNLNGAVDKTVHFGSSSDTPVVGDYNGDGTTDIGVFRASTGNWYLDTNLNGGVDKTVHFGSSSDTPVVGDYNGDGTTDIGVFRASTGNWYLDTNLNGVVDKTIHFGSNSDTPVVGDFNGDGTTDIGVFRASTGNWYLDTDLNGVVDKTIHFGSNSDTPVVGDFNGDGTTDIGVFRSSAGNWYLDTNLNGGIDKTVHFGSSSDKPVVGDFNGDGTTDIGVFRPSAGTWYLDTDLNGVVDKTIHFGSSSDTPVVGKWS